MADRQDGQVIDPVGEQRAERPGQGGAPVVPHHVGTLDAQLVQDARDVAHQVSHAVRPDVVGLVGTPVAAQVRDDDPEAGLGQRRNLMPP